MFRRRRRRPAPAPPPWWVEIVDAHTEVAHRVSAHAQATGIAARRGRFTTLCGHELLVASLSAAPRSRCRACAATSSPGEP